MKRRILKERIFEYFLFLEDTARKLNGKQHLEEADVTAGKFAKEFGRQLPFCGDSRLPGSIGGASPRESNNHQGEPLLGASGRTPSHFEASSPVRSASGSHW